jgi:hypothetical protein
VNLGPRSWATGIVSGALAVLVACYCLNLAAVYLLQALPVLIPAGLVGLIGFGIWRWRTRSDRW